MTTSNKTTIAHKVKELTESAHYLENEKGNKTDIVLSLEMWEQFLLWLEDVEDQTSQKPKQESWLGCMKGTGRIIGDIIAPTEDATAWEVLSE